MDFYEVKIREKKDSLPMLYPDWMVGRSNDLMVRGKSFYAIWDEEKNLWSKDEYDVPRLVDQDLRRHAAERGGMDVLDLRSFNTNVWSTFRKFMMNLSDNHTPLDEKLIFANTIVKKTDYASHILPYSLEPGSHEAWDELVGVLYSPEERDKIEWAIGAVISGDAKKIQKFLVFYGPGGTGKSTVLNIIYKMFEGYVTTFDAKALGSANNSFATEVFRHNPLVAIQHDGDLSRIDDNTKLNSIVSHEEMPMNEKYKPGYSAKINAFLFMGTNQPVKISDAKSGIIRRLIDVHPTGVKHDSERYLHLITRTDFELGAIAHHCLERYQQMGKNYYNSYKPIEMMLQTDVFYNYIEANYDIFKEQNGVSLKQAYELYKTFCSETGIDKILPQYKFREELRNYFKDFHDQKEIDGRMLRSYYEGFKKLTTPDPFKPDETYKIVFGEMESTLDRVYSDMPAQYATDDEKPKESWASVKTKLKDIDTSKIHYVKIPEAHILIDFDLVNEHGEKDFELNCFAASQWPPTYAEVSKGGAGVHLHYVYLGDTKKLSPLYEEGIEIKVLPGDASLRRKLTLSNGLEIATLTKDLPKKETKMIEHTSIKSEKGLRDLIDRNLRKEIHAGTKPSIDFIHHILETAYNDGLSYDVRDLRPNLLSFAASSTNQSATCIKTVQKMQFIGKSAMPERLEKDVDESRLVFFDVEVYPNLFVVCWKYQGDADLVRMINPTPQDIEELFKFKLVGFNNRRYDNHILYARYLGYTNDEIYKLSQRIINSNNNNHVLFGPAYNMSYTDIYDFSNLKQSLKKFEIDLGIHHMELDIPWDEPVPEELWPKVVDYCCNDVIATEKTFESRHADFVARQILSEISGLSVNHTTPNQTARIIFGEDKEPQKQFIYTDLREEFPGYRFDGKESIYKGEIVGEGGFVYSEPAIWENVALLDIVSMHPTSLEILNMFGPNYTPRFSEIKEARVAIKQKDFEKARSMLNGKLAPFLVDESIADDLAYALKIAINTVYGLTSAKFPNAFKDNRNHDNIVAKRGALFMIDLMEEVQMRGFTVAHIKTDSIKIPNATPDIIQFVTDFGNQYGYTFELEGTYDKFCLINDAVYIARQGDKWTAVGAQFKHPYVFKKLFTGEEITFDDLCESKSVQQGRMYLDFNESELRKVTEFVHVGRTGSFVPVIKNGANLWRIKDDKRYAVTGTKGYRWIEREMAEARDEPYENFVDYSYFDHLAEEAEKAIEFYGSFKRFVS